MINRITAREHQPAAGNLSDKKTLAAVALPIKRRYTKHRPDRQAGYGKNKRIARQHIISVSLIRAMTVGGQFLQFKYSSVETVKCRIASKGTACRNSSSVSLLQARKPKIAIKTKRATHNMLYFPTIRLLCLGQR